MEQNKTNNWLLTHAQNIFSQYGEDGIIEQIIKTVGEGEISPWCVEFGAWDGKHLSNTHRLMTERGWSGVFIEGDEKKVEDLKHTYSGNNKAFCLSKFVSFEGGNTLDNLLKETPIPVNFGLLSIDIDGNDYHIWDSLHVYQPILVVIEINPSIPSHIEFIQPRDMSVNQGSSILSLTKLAKEKGYELVSATSHNAFYIKREFYPKFGISDNSPAVFKDTRHQIEIFQLYDGTIVLSGSTRFLWHGLRFSDKSFQIIPKCFRFYPGVMGPIRGLLFKIWRKTYLLFFGVN